MASVIAAHIARHQRQSSPASAMRRRAAERRPSPASRGDQSKSQPAGTGERARCDADGSRHAARQADVRRRSVAAPGQPEPELSDARHPIASFGRARRGKSCVTWHWLEFRTACSGIATQSAHGLSALQAAVTIRRRAWFPGPRHGAGASERVKEFHGRAVNRRRRGGRRRARPASPPPSRWPRPASRPPWSRRRPPRTIAPPRCSLGSVTALETLGVWDGCRDAGGAASGRCASSTRRAADARARGAVSRPTRSGSTRSATTSRTGTCSPRSRRARASFRPCAGSTTKRSAVEIGGGRVDHHAARRRHVSRPAGGRRRRTAFAVPRRRRHRDRAAALSADRADLQPAPCAAAPRHLDRVPHRDTVRSRWCRCRARGRASSASSSRREAERLGALDDAALAGEIERRSHSILGKIEVEPGRGLFPLEVETARAFAAQPDRADRRSRAPDPADRRAGPQSRPARRRDHRRAGGRSPPQRRGRRRAGAARALRRQRRADVTSRTRRGRSAQPLAADRFPPDAGRARPRPLSHRPDRAAAARGDARGRRAAARSRA